MEECTDMQKNYEAEIKKNYFIPNEIFANFTLYRGHEVATHASYF